MKSHNIQVLLAFLLLVVIGCDPEEKPSRTKLLTAQNWKLKSVNGSTNFSGSLTLTFEADGDYKEVIVDEYGSTFTYEGDWKFIDNESEIEIEYSDGDEWQVDVEELTAEKLVVEDAGDEYEFRH